MSIDVRELQPGDRVVLNCPGGKGEKKREAQFDGIFDEYAKAMDDDSARRFVFVQPGTAAFAQSNSQWARFLLQTVAAGDRTLLRTPSGHPLPVQPKRDIESRVLLIIAVEPDGGLREVHGLRIFIERRLRMGHG